VFDRVCLPVLLAALNTTPKYLQNSNLYILLVIYFFLAKGGIIVKLIDEKVVV